MNLKVITFLLFCLAAAGCKSTAPPPANTQQVAATTAPSSSAASPSTLANAPPDTTVVKPKLDACALLNGSEIQSVQGEAVKETKLSGQIAGGLTISQCFFTLPTFNNSISLIVAHKGEGPGAREPKEFWQMTFHAEKKNEKGEIKAGGKREEESDPPRRIGGLGDEAFWMGNRIAGALYVLKCDAYVRVSVGGPSDKASQTRARMLAQKAITRL